MFANRRTTPIEIWTSAVWTAVWAMLVTGCYETYREDPVGSLNVSFEIAYNGTSCEAAGVERVAAVLDGGMYQVETDCSQYELTFENIPEGTHDLALYGLNEAGTVVVDNLADGLATVEIVAYTETASAAPLVLRESPVVLEARWDLDWGSCASRGIAYFQTQVFNLDDKVILNTLIACETPGSGNGEYRIMPDPKRALVNPEIGRIEIHALKNKVKPLGETYVVLFDAPAVPGPGESIFLSFKCLEDGCFSGESACPIQ